jgi:hypothetical protein
MAEKYTGKLVQSKGSFQIRGIIVGINPETAIKNNGYIEGKTKEKNVPYRSIRFRVKTSDENIITTELFGQIMEKVYVYNKSEKKTLPCDWDDRKNLPEGYEIIANNINNKKMVAFDAVKVINDTFNDGDSVVITGEIQFSTYKNNSTGDTVLQKKYVIKNMFSSTEAVDFDKEGFEEENTFTQEIVIRDTEKNRADGKLYVYAYVIEYGGKFNPAIFEVDLGEYEDVSNYLGKIKFGGFIKVSGTINNRTASVVEDDEEVIGKKAPKRTSNSFQTLLKITGAYPKSYEAGKYSQDDFDNALDTTEASNSLKNLEKALGLEEEEELPFDLE